MNRTVQFLLVLMLCTRSFAVEENLILAESFPKELSKFGFFIDESAQVPHEDVIPYELISTLFSDFDAQ